MKVYAGTDKYNSSLVGIIYSSGKVYEINNGSEELIGEVKNDKFYMFSKYLGRYSNVPTMGGGGRIYISSEGEEIMGGFRDGGKYYAAKNIDDYSLMIGFHVGDFLNGMNGSYVAAYTLIMLSSR